MAVVDDDRHGACELEAQVVAHLGAGILENKRCLLGQQFLPFVVINIEMGGL